MLKDLPPPANTNPRGIPEAPFLSNIDEFCANNEDATHMLQVLSEQMQKYQFMELTTKERKQSLQAKIPDIEKSLEMSRFLTKGQGFETRYEINDTVFTTAKIEPTETVMVWLGAGTMLEYPVEEAITLLAGKLESANANLESCNEDLEFLRECITTMEVNTARVVNWRVTHNKGAAGKS